MGESKGVQTPVHANVPAHWLHNRALLEATKRGGLELSSPSPSRGPRGGGQAKWLYHPCTSWGPESWVESKGLHSPYPLMVPNAWREQGDYITMAVLARP